MASERPLAGLFPERASVSGAMPSFIVDKRQPRPAGFVAEAFERLLQDVEGEDWQRDGLADTPARAAQAWAERTAGYRMDPASVFKTFDGEGYDEMVALAPIPFHSTCEHHIEDFEGVAAVVYIADGKIVGLSKMARLVDVFALRLQNQERLTQQIADAMVEHLRPKGVMVRMEGSHKCCERRGVRKAGMVARTSVVRGAMKEDPKARAEALDLIR